MSKVIHVQISIPRQYQMMTSSVVRVIFIKTKVISGIIPKASQTKFHQTRITKPKVIHVEILIRKREKTKKSGGEGLQIGAALGISNRGEKITNRDRDFKS